MKLVRFKSTSKLSVYLISGLILVFVNLGLSENPLLTNGLSPKVNSPTSNMRETPFLFRWATQIFPYQVRREKWLIKKCSIPIARAAE